MVAIAVKVYLPDRADDELTQAIYRLSGRLGKLYPEKQKHGLLGGEYGYGQDFENDVFLMHSFCWCEREECKWCNGKAPNFLHKKSGFSLTWYKYIGRDMRANRTIKRREIRKILRECLSSLPKLPRKEKTPMEERSSLRPWSFPDAYEHIRHHQMDEQRAKDRENHVDDSHYE
jgi:hypothetical protein